MATAIVSVGCSIGIGVDPEGPLSNVTDPSVAESVNSQFAAYVRDTLLAGNDLTNLDGVAAPSSGSPVVSFAPLQFAVNSVSGGLSTPKTTLALNELLEAVEDLGGGKIRVGQEVRAAPGVEYKFEEGQWRCCSTQQLLIDRGGSYVPATFTAIVDGKEYPASLHITVGWVVPTSIPVLSPVPG